MHTDVAITTELSTGTKVLLVAAMIHAALFGAAFFYMASALAGVAPAVQPVYPDVIAPYVSLDEPQDGASLFNEVIVTALAYDETWVSQVSFLINGRVAHVDRSAKGGWTMQWYTFDVPEGTYTLSAFVEDQAGNIGYSPVRTVVVRYSL